jgi:hypothetical protein
VLKKNSKKIPKMLQMAEIEGERSFKNVGRFENFWIFFKIFGKVFFNMIKSALEIRKM